MVIKITVSPLCSSILDFCDIKDYITVNPYKPSDVDKKLIQKSNVLILIYGYKKNVFSYFNGTIIEFKTTTIDDLISNL